MSSTAVERAVRDMSDASKLSIDPDQRESSVFLTIMSREKSKLINDKKLSSTVVILVISFSLV